MNPKRHLFAISALLAAATTAPAAVTFTVDPSATWLGYMNVFNLPADGGGFQFGSGWGTGDLVASFAGGNLTLAPNTIGDPNPYWYIGGGGPGAQGNKIMDANFYVQHSGTYAGQSITFTGVVVSNTFTAAHNAVAFIRDFAPDFSSVIETTAPLVNGVFSITQTATNDPARHIQYGFQVVGENVWVTDVAPFGNAVVTAIPEPTALTLGLFGLALGLRRRRA